VFVDVGVTAYHGAAPLITSSVYLDKAAGILAAEAYHAGAVRMLLFNFGMASETMKIANLRATLDGTINTYRLGNQPAYLRSSASTGL
jgi:Ferritin-like domain